MATCKCFKCGRGFESINEDDVVGDGQCKECIERSKKVALKVDIEMAQRRSGEVFKEKDPAKVRAEIIQDIIHNPNKSTWLNARDLGINPNG